MASADELKLEIEAAQGELRRALEGAGASWEQGPGGDEWSPRQVAEHAVGTALSIASMVDEVLGQPAREQPEFSFASAEEALLALSEADDASAVYGRVQDVDLEKPAPWADNLAGLMGIAVSHAREHAEQIAGAA